MLTKREPELLGDEMLDVANGGMTYPATEYDFVPASFTDGCNHCVCTEGASDSDPKGSGLPTEWVARRKKP